MTEQDSRVERRDIADALVRALEWRHELLDAIVESEDYDAAIEAIATLIGTSLVAAEAVLRLSFDRLTKVSRDRIAAELEDLNSQLSFTGRAVGEPGTEPGAAAVRGRQGPRHLRRAHRRRACGGRRLGCARR